QELLLLY
ncbi:Cytochrome C oxidase, partial [Monkeypox virus]